MRELRGLLIRGLALLLPLWVLGLAFVWTGSRQNLTGHSLMFSEQLAQRDPEVLVLGSSLALRGVDERVLAQELGVDRSRVLVLGLPHASAAHDLAILRHRVFGAGFRPRVVILADALRPLLTHELLAEPINLEHLAENLEPSDADLVERVFGQADPWALRVATWRAKAAGIRDAFLAFWRDRAVALMFQPRGGIAGAPALVDGVNNRLFAGVEQQVGDTRLYGSLGRLGGVPVTGEDFSLRQNGLLDLLAQSVQAYGGELVIARLPLPPGSAGVDDVPPDMDRDARAWLEALGVAFIDLRGLPLTEDDFEDSRHLSPRGAATATKFLGDAMLAWREGAVPETGLESGALPAVTLPPSPALTQVEGCRFEAHIPMLAGLARDQADLPDAVPWPLEVRAYGRPLTRSAQPPAPCAGAWYLDAQANLIVQTAQPGDKPEVRWMPAVQSASTGEPVLWLAPQMRVTWARSRESDVGLRLRARRYGPPAGFEVGGQPALVGEGEGHAAWVEGTIDEGVVLFNPSAQTWWLVHQLVVGDPPFGTTLLGRAETLRASASRLIGGLDYLATPQVHFEGEIPQITPARRQVKGSVVGLLVGRMSGLSDVPDLRIPKISRCSPLRVTYQGALVEADAHTVCNAVSSVGHGRSCHAGRVVWASSPDGRPIDDPQDYGLTFDAARTCEVFGLGTAMAIREAWWLYPGNTMQIVIPPERLERFREGARALVVEILSLVDGLDDPVGVRLEADGAVVLDTVWTPSAGPAGPRGARFELEPQLSPATRSLTLTLSNRSPTRFILLASALLTEAEGIHKLEATAAPLHALAARRLGKHPDPRPLRVLQGQTRTAAVPDFFAPITSSVLATYGLSDASPLWVRSSARPLERVHAADILTSCTACFFDDVYTVSWVGPAEVMMGVRPIFGFPTSAPVAGGTAWWIYHGQSGVWTLPPSDQPRRVQVALRGFSFIAATAGEGAFLRLQGRIIPFGPLEVDGTRRADAVITPESEPVDLVVVEGTGTSELLIDQIVLEDERGVHAILAPVEAEP